MDKSPRSLQLPQVGAVSLGDVGRERRADRRVRQPVAPPAAQDSHQQLAHSIDLESLASQEQQETLHIPIFFS